MPLLSGVYQAKKIDGTIYYRSSITYQNKHISLGSFSSEINAHIAYKEASLLVKSNKAVDNYKSSHSLLSFSKWVVLINFRDNNIYIKTPIYIYHNYFIYYLDKQTFLKFDVDDLFYYSTHTIMKRGKHLFVSDYGMHINIQSRYGIKNFAIPGKDFKFVNGDNTDYRYANIEIINRYYGVNRVNKKGRPIYITKIHINGDYIVGRYPTDIEAAIAYNKAALLLMEKGLNKNFPSNYIDTLKPEDYEKIYDKIFISKKIRSWER